MSVTSQVSPGVQALERMVQLFDQALQQALDALVEAPVLQGDLVADDLAMDARILRDEGLSLLPAGFVLNAPLLVESSEVSALVLLQRAESVSRELSISQFPEGMSALIVRLVDALRDRS
ncbi:hypothetical protein [Ornithinimicrobium sp. INDO-MA30-4]|uniref:hypothetical protein n=1 Tax=Ornithinimicrobium sp. INDO-MA30-4 TaxID=2908651 RepID=UPI001F32F942|nr:hypothetical protein [Ornithinimicrobium sp. INDO-MA30-4]UJH71723.1 hypothetical protein L0A91_16695 [Ornithinimicrobium sp. INDO-MA30-4]